MPKRRAEGPSEGKSKKPARTKAVSRGKPAAPGAETIYPLKITLQHVQPPVWRQVETADCSLATLHDLIQVSMGWENAHLHEFEIGRERFGDPMQWEGGFGSELEVGDEGKVRLSQLVAAGIKKFRYVYDMGDTWEHVIQIAKPGAAEPGARYPRCVAGERACPPEDCGGPWGYGDFLDAIQDPNHEQHEDMVEWIGGGFDPEKFDVDAVNKELKRVR